MHPGRGPGLTARRLGERGGVESVTLSEAQMPNHNHSFQAASAPSNSNTPGGAALANPAVQAVRIYGNAANLVAMAGNAIGNAGGSQQHNNMQPFLTMNFIIALVGLYPSRG
jgi:microcystin-dependent protein